MDADAPAAALPRETSDSEPSAARVSEVRAALREAGIADVRTAAVERAAYSSDGSLFRVVPAAVVFPRTAAEVGDALSVARRLGVPVTSRGAGTTLAGNAIGPGIVLDFSVHMNRILDIDAGQRAAWVEPGVVHAQLQAAVKPYGLRFGPDPSTHSRCTIGGMIGNNACGPRAMGYGRTVDNILALRVMLIDGSVVTLTGDDGDVFPRLQELVNNHLGLIRTQLGTFSRQVSGYGLEHLLPENGCDARRAFAGSEGTWGVVLAAKMRLVADPAHVTAVVLGYADMPTAADDVPVLSQFPVTACEGMDRRMVDRLIEEKGPGAVPPMPAGGGWMLVELAGDDPAALERQAAELIEASHADDAMVLPGEESGPIWKIRADGAGLVSRTPDGRDCHAGWEDSAVPPEKLGDYLRDLMSLLEEHGLWALPYGHFGDGCLHMRVDFPLDADGGRQVMRDFMFAAAELVAAYGGSVSGEHGDGRARGELLASMYSPEAMRLFAAVKHLFDPRGLLNPGIIVDPDPLDERIRLASIRPGDMPPARRQLGFSFASDSGDFATAVHRCTGVGKCRADAAASGAVMCPSYQATKDEKHSTRGRARVLQEMVDGRLVDGGWRSPEVHEALDLCLSCKACGSECPTGTDMATYKAEVLNQSYRGRVRPLDHYVLGWLPDLAKLASPIAALANLPQRLPPLGKLAKKTANIDTRRNIPTFTHLPFTRWFAQRTGHNRTLPAREHGGRHAGLPERVVLFADTWSNFFAPRILAATVEVLRRTGVDVHVTPTTECCGLTWISTGQLDTARTRLHSTIAALDATAAEVSTASGTDAPPEVPIIVVEPSCAATLRDDAERLLGTEAAGRVAGRVQTLAEFLLGAGAELPDLSGTTAIVQPHCHHNAVMGFAADRELMTRAGMTIEVLGGCCGLAGNFGVTDGHYEVSQAVGEVALLPALRTADPQTIVLADGYSCRTQISDLTEHAGVHLAELLATHLSPNWHAEAMQAPPRR
ncbi:FAD-binding and (Fe-S)-binding domain-containing protein [Brevibacterium otitidis]|uniref:FAD-binding and (Fe-S)-binding domain-containing protein n=1 Tax=Brevibacterium otitidis TaxID=53364 RepID=A0ABV5X075_9MICO|nr:FAD-binding and (Fe-S)-binding domain-containing protein [Brevibacterium otitidis]